MTDVHTIDEALGSWRDYSEPSLPPLLQSSLACFVDQGYHGTTMRVLASNAGLSVPGLYHHYSSKQAILIAIMQRAMEDLFERSMVALAQAGDSVESKLRLHIECLVLFHAYRGSLAFVAASEIRSLTGDARERHIAARDRQQAILDQIVREGVAQGLFLDDFPRDTTRAIVTMCTGVAQWFYADGTLTAEEIAERYVAISLRALGYKD